MAGFLALPAVPGVDQRLQEFLDHDDAGNRIAGNAQNGPGPAIAQDRGLAGFDGNAVIKHLADLPDGGGGVVVPPGGGAGVEDHHVALAGGFGEHVTDLVEAVRHDGIGLRHRAPVLQHGGKDGGIELQDVARLRVGAGRDDLVPGGDDPHHGLADDFCLENAACDHGADRGGTDLHEARQDHLPGADIFADLANMLPGCRRGVDRNAAVVVLDDVLHHDDRVAALGDRVAGIDHGEAVGAERHGRGLGGAEAVPGMKGDAVHGAGRIVRGIDVGVDRTGCDAAVSLLDRNGLDLHGKAVFLQLPEILSFRLFQRNVGQVFKAHIQSFPCRLPLRGSCRRSRLMRFLNTDIPAPARLWAGPHSRAL